MRNTIAALAAALLISAPLVAQAQEAPSYAAVADNGDEQIRGRIASFDGGYNLQVNDDKGYVDNVQLHQGTIINPTGLTLQPGMVVSILGYNSGSTFDANEVDTPYNYYAGEPYYLGHPWDYYGPTIGLGFFFGTGGWWHGPAFYGAPYAWNGGIRIYSTVNFGGFYHGGYYNGANYIAPGGYGHPNFPGGYHGYGPSYSNGAGGYHGGPSFSNGPGSYHGPSFPGGQGGYHSSGPSYAGGQGGYHGNAAPRGAAPSFRAGGGGFRSGGGGSFHGGGGGHVGGGGHGGGHH